jgi:hypothetical protein
VYCVWSSLTPTIKGQLEEGLSGMQRDQAYDNRKLRGTMLDDSSIYTKKEKSRISSRSSRSSN